jgi:release factor glutamine methyltransferase
MTATDRATTVGEAVARTQLQLRASGSPSPRLDAEVLAAHVIGRDRAWLLAHPETPMTERWSDDLRAAAERRSTGEPIAYIRGFKEWLSLRVRTDARALVPRPETEVLAQAAIAEVEARLAASGVPVVAWEVATGSGAVAVALALRFRRALESGDLTLIATDESEQALALAAENFADHAVGSVVTVARADLLASAGASLPRPDVVVANLPYLSTEEVDAAAGSLAHEPRIALEAGSDGLALLRRLFDELPTRAAPGATVLLEVAMAQAEAVIGLAPPRATTSSLPDLAGVPRVVIVRLPA